MVFNCDHFGQCPPHTAGAALKLDTEAVQPSTIRAKESDGSFVHPTGGFW